MTKHCGLSWRPSPSRGCAVPHTSKTFENSGAQGTAAPFLGMPPCSSRIRVLGAVRIRSSSFQLSQPSARCPLRHSSDVRWFSVLGPLSQFLDATHAVSGHVFPLLCSLWQPWSQCFSDCILQDIPVLWLCRMSEDCFQSNQV